MKISEQVVFRNAEELHPHPRNHEFHSEHTETEYTILKTSIEQDEIQEAIWVTNNMIVSGETRWRIAQELGMKQIPTREITDVDEEEILYLLIQANAARRGDEKDPMKKSKMLQLLYNFWIKRKQNAQEFQSGTLLEQSDIMKIAGSKTGFYRLLKLNNLIPELQKEVSNGVIGQQAGVELAALPKEEQQAVYEAIRSTGLKNIRTDEIKAICQERKKTNHKPLKADVSFEEEPLVIDNMDDFVKHEFESIEEEGTPGVENSTKTTLDAFSKILSDDDANEIKTKILQRRSEIFLRKLEGFVNELKSVKTLEGQPKEVYQMFQTILERVKEIEKKIQMYV